MTDLDKLHVMQGLWPKLEGANRNDSNGNDLW